MIGNGLTFTFEKEKLRQKNALPLKILMRLAFNSSKQAAFLYINKKGE